mmetsp:Transcript_39850/g.106899  ORF Transcript_39850/g.106899 Transcript_39850/m.106899 type:complete len:304 (-) Transcript_39850:434-1345(-)
MRCARASASSRARRSAAAPLAVGARSCSRLQGRRRLIRQRVSRGWHQQCHGAPRPRRPLRRQRLGGGLEGNALQGSLGPGAPGHRGCESLDLPAQRLRVLQARLEVARDPRLADRGAQERAQHAAPVDVLASAVGVGQHGGLEVVGILAREVDQRRVGGWQISGNHRVLPAARRLDHRLHLAPSAAHERLLQGPALDNAGEQGGQVRRILRQHLAVPRHRRARRGLAPRLPRVRVPPCERHGDGHYEAVNRVHIVVIVVWTLFRRQPPREVREEHAMTGACVAVVVRTWGLHERDVSPAEVVW